ncbi:MAG: T9SS type A sorting domain-containing protein [Bacteroidota bacterium]
MKRHLLFGVLAIVSLSCISQDISLYFQVLSKLDHDEVKLYAYNASGRDIKLSEVQFGVIYDSLQSYAPQIRFDKFEESFQSENSNARLALTQPYVYVDSSINPPVERDFLFINGARLNYTLFYQNSLNRASGSAFTLVNDGTLQEIMSITFGKFTEGLDTDFYVGGREVFHHTHVYDEVGNEISIEVSTISSITYPVEWLSFEVSQMGYESVDLSWTTARETNNAFFQVEKSQDGVLFQGIGEVESKGNTSNNTSYSFLDKAAKGQKIYYRLRQLDVDGTFSYSDVREINMDMGPRVELSIFPNPSQDMLKATFLNVQKGEYSLKVIDLNGRVLEQQRLKADHQILEHQLSVLNWIKGTYWLILEDKKGFELYAKPFQVK